jgi:nitrate reductase gamma subunit
MIDSFLFVGLPYTATFLFVIGSILRFKNYGYSVTSHSSQFLESNKLFYGSRFFHTGIVLIIIGHIIGFLIPNMVIRLTTHPIALTTVELLAFAFAIVSLLGIFILIFRRIFLKRLHKVTSIMDVVVYLIIAIQIITGLLVAYQLRWGSTWYASSLVPYLKSLCIFTPDMSVISSMTLFVKIHVITAFTLIGLIPFTRLIHFISYPYFYIWRNYQLVIWNRNQKQMRVSKNTREGMKPKNN